ncbi:hypothetical protein H310_15203 [Aphanomyces invadans]|uniref:Uncharacterized protein n=1 Tax=Aphanomyces invadans TaxID=157072 RepID=A0A024T7T8_9STRA|nr:hypothetical protein H310_15203 [Aphanomyces invadans]ETV89958.1 hypothetical protein H310_15203 [Aphanomyces invadans]|eukprot:XP_008881410.1 hypothetical protein H310_15203 [Aphanomyces invadans]
MPDRKKIKKRITVRKKGSTMQREDRHVLFFSTMRVPIANEELLPNVAEHVSPPNITAFLQPQDVGIIQALNNKFGEFRTLL